MTGDVIAWSLTILMAAVAVAGAVWLRRRLDTTTAAAEQAARAAGAERARIEEERRVLAEKNARLEAELANERASRQHLVGALDLMPVPVWRRDPDLKIVDCNIA